MASASATVQILVALRDAVTGPLKAISRTFASVFSGLRGLATGALGAGFLVATKNIAQAQEAMLLMSRTTKSTVEEISQLKFALNSIGKADNLRELLNQLEGKRSDALRAPGQSRDSFARLGVSINELRKLGSVEILKQISEGYVSAGKSADAAANLQAIFGDQFRELLPLLGQGAEGFKKLAEQSDKFGATVSTEEALRAAEFEKNWRLAAQGAETAFRKLTQNALPAFIDGLKVINGLLSGGSLSTLFKQISMGSIPESDRLRNLLKIIEAGNDVVTGLSNFQRDQLSEFGITASKLDSGGDILLGDKKTAKDAINKRLADIAGVGGDPNEGTPIDEGFWKGLQEQIDLTAKSLDNMRDLGKQTALALQNAFSSNITSAIRAVRTGALSVKDALDSLLDGLIDDIAEFATSELVKRLISAGLSFLGGSTSSGEGDAAGKAGFVKANGGGGTGLLGGGLGGFKRLGGGGGTTINVYGAQTAEEQRATVSAIMRDQIGRNRQVRLDLRAV